MQSINGKTEIAAATGQWRGVHAFFEGSDGATVFVLACPASLDLGQVPPLRERAQSMIDQAVARMGAALDVDGAVRGFFAPFGIVALRSEHLSEWAKAAERGLKN
jgi:hypothetical protein